MTAQTERLKVLAAGIVSLILALGIARFAYTPLLPIMQLQTDLDVSEGGWLAAINYMGYLCGAICASLINSLVLKDKLYRLGLIVAVLTTAGMGLTDNLVLWAILRFFAGLSSAAGLLLGSGLILNWLIRHHHPSELGIQMSGAGLGIALGALAVAAMEHYLSWNQQWLLLSLIGIVLLVPAWRWLPPPDTSGKTQSGETLQDHPPSALFQRIFMLAYFCAGAGYVVSATFIVAIVEQLPGMAGQGSWSFVILGLAAAPACIIWDLIARRIGYLPALLATYLLQAISIILPAITSEPGFVYFSTALFGATFIGAVSLVLSLAGRYYPTRPAKMMGKLTASYGVAQIITPAITGVLAEAAGNYNQGLYLAGGMMVIGSLFVLQLMRLEQHNPPAAV